MTDEVVAAVADVYSREWARVLASTVTLARDLDIAEECTHDAFVRALQSWPQAGLPGNPGAWLTTVARNRVLDVQRRQAVLERALPYLVVDPVPGPEDALDDDRLRLIFICCHPALSRDAQVALTLRLVCGLSTVEVARAFLVTESTMAARVTRAKQKIAKARLPYRIPSPDKLGERTSAVLEVIHLIFTTGHRAPVGQHLQRRDLVDSAIRLARTLHLIMPTNPEVAALLSLVLLNEARADTRVSATGRLLLLSEQDRSRWDRALIEEGTRLLTASLVRQQATRYAVEAAIAAVHAEAPTWGDTDWHQIVGLYDLLVSLWPSPVVRLNHAVAIGHRDGPRVGLEALTPLLSEPTLAAYSYLSATRGDFLRQLREWALAAQAYEDALLLCDNDVERAFLSQRLDEIRSRR
ncbi:MAG: RNA polymerase sigma factor [Phycicoccus sp.]